MSKSKSKAINETERPIKRYVDDPDSLEYVEETIDLDSLEHVEKKADPKPKAVSKKPASTNKKTATKPNVKAKLAVKTVNKVNSEKKALDKTLKLARNPYKTTVGFLNSRIDLPQLITLFVIMFVTSQVELINTFMKGKANVVSSRIWMLSLIICLVFFVVKCAKQIVNDIKHKNIFLLIGFAVVIGGLFYLMLDNTYSDFSFESAKQVTPALAAYKTAGWNFIGTAFLEYPIKQYLINAIPSLILGRSILSIHLGYGLPFVIGLTMLYLEVRSWLRLYRLDEKLSLILVYAIVAFPFIDEFYCMFEQVITPVSYTMMILALSLKMLRKPTFASSFAQLWVGGMLAYTYTPTLASLGLYLVFLLYVIALSVINKKMSDRLATNKKWIYIGLCAIHFINTLEMFICTLIPGRHDRFDSGEEERKLIDSFKDSTPFVKQYFTDQNIVFFGIFGGLVLLYFALAITLRLKVWDLCLSLWTIAVAYSSKMLSGYLSGYEIELIPHRTMIIVPVISTAIFIWFVKFLKDNKLKFKKDILSVMLAGLMLFSCYNVSQPHRAFDYVNHIHTYKFGLDYVTDVVGYHGLDSEDEMVIVLHIENNLMSNLGDYAVYLWPNAHVYVCDYSTLPDIEREFIQLPRIVFSDSDRVETLYGVDFSTRTYANPRYANDENEGQSHWYIKYYEGTGYGN